MLKIIHLCKAFGSIQAVNDVSFDMEKGEVLGFLGPNGAGRNGSKCTYPTNIISCRKTSGA